MLHDRPDNSRNNNNSYHETGLRYVTCDFDEMTLTNQSINRSISQTMLILFLIGITYIHAHTHTFCCFVWNSFKNLNIVKVANACAKCSLVIKMVRAKLMMKNVIPSVFKSHQTHKCSGGNRNRSH